MSAQKTPFAVVTCPHCEAPFKVSLKDPRLRRGGVRARCTSCERDFDLIRRLRLEISRAKRSGAPRHSTLPAEDVVMLSDDDVEELSRTPPPPPRPPTPPRPAEARDRPGATSAQAGTIEVPPDSPQPDRDGVTNVSIEDDVAAPIAVRDDPPASELASEPITGPFSEPNAEPFSEPNAEPNAEPFSELDGIGNAFAFDDPPPTHGELPLDDLIPPLPEPFDPAHKSPSPLPIPVAPTKPASRHLGPPGIDVDTPFSSSELPPIEEAEPLGPPLPKRPTVEVTEAGTEDPAPTAEGSPAAAASDDDSAALGLDDESLELEVEVRPPDSVPPEPLEDDDPQRWSWVRAARPAASALLRRADEEYEALAQLLEDVVSRSGAPREDARDTADPL